MFKNHITTKIIPVQKHIALIAHDSKKKEMIAWVKRNEDILKSHFLCGTGTTAQLISKFTQLPVKDFQSGPLGGDQQIGSRIVEGKIDCLIFFWDPLAAQPHDPDVKALLRIAVVYDIPIANNRATADFILASQFMSQDYEHFVDDYDKSSQDRIEQFSNQEE